MHMNKQYFFLILIFICINGFSQNSFITMKNQEAFKLKLKEVSKSTNTIESDFTQNKNLSILAKPISSKGKFCYKKENKVRWEYTEPYTYLIVIKDTKIFIKDKSNQKQYDTQSNKMFQELNNFLVGCINGDILNKTNDFKIEFKENDNQFYVILVPIATKMKQMINEIHIYFDKKDYSVTKLKMVEQGGDNTTIDFINKKLNGSISDEKFNFN